MPDLSARIRRRGERAQVGMAPHVATQLASYIARLRQWNARMNLTALDESDGGLDRLVVEPLAAARHLPRRGQLVDIGSGAGSPAIPLQVVRPDLAVRMVEGKVRKGAFLREVVRHLALRQARVEGCRYEALLARPDLHEAHDVLTVRAVRIDAAVLRCLQVFVIPGGVLALFRSCGSAEVPPDLEPPLVWQATYPLVASLRSRLVVIRKSLPPAVAPAR